MNDNNNSNTRNNNIDHSIPNTGNMPLDNEYIMPGDGDNSRIVSDMEENTSSGEDVLDLTGAVQKGQDGDNEGDLTFGLSDEELESTKHQTPVDDENDIERATERENEFTGLKDSEMLDSKTQLHPDDKKLIMSGFSFSDDDDDNNSGQNSSLVVDRSIDSQEMDTMDPGMQRDDRVTEDDTTGAHIDDYELNDDAVSTTDRLVNE